MQKAFENFTWENSPSTATPMGAALLNTLNEAINEIDDRVCEQDGEISEVVVKTRDIIEKAEKATERAEEVAVIAEASAALAKEASEEAKEASEEIKASTEAIAKNTEDIEKIDEILPTKQDKLTAGANIQIENNVISATGGGSGSVGVVDNLLSNSTTDALSANQGRVLDKKISYYEQTGYLSKNLIPFPYFHSTPRNIYGIDFTTDANGIITANGTATAAVSFNLTHPTVLSTLVKLDKNKTYVFFNPNRTDVANKVVCGCRWYREGETVSTSTGTNTSLATKDSIVGTGYVLAHVYVYVYQNATLSNVKLAPMLSEANADGSYPAEYMPYSKSNYDLTSENSSNVASGYIGKNYIPNRYVEDTKTVNGVSFSRMADGTIIVNGKATADTTFNMTNASSGITVPAGGYYFSCSPKGGSTSTYYVAMGDGTNRIVTDIGEVNRFSLASAKTVSCYIRIVNGFTANNLVFKPVLSEVPNNSILSRLIGTTLTSSTINASDVSYTFTDASIKTDSMIDIYDTIYGFNPKSVTVTNGSCVITFDAQSTSHQIKLKIS